MPELPDDNGNSARFRVATGRLGITLEGASAHLMADVQRVGNVSVPYTVVAGVVHILPYFGKKPVEIGFSRGKMRVDATVFHNRNIVLSVPAENNGHRS